MDLVVPTLGESILEAVIAKWLKKVGEPTNPDEPVVDLETDKVSVQLPAPGRGVLAEQRFAEGATVRVGQVIGTITENAATVAAAAPVAVAAPAPVAVAAPAPAAVAAPVAVAAPAPAPAAAPVHPAPSRALSPTERLRARESGSEVTPFNAPPPTLTSLPAPKLAEREELVPMSPLRKRIAERLVAAQHTAAVLTTFNEIDMTNLLALRARHQEAFIAKHGTKVGFMSFFTRAVVAALKDFPVLNAEIHGTDIIYKKHYDIGIAVGSGRGLVVPVLRNADQLGFAEIEKGIAVLANKAKDNKLTLEDLSGGTFTITNGGIYGSMMSTPLLNLPQTGILGMHNVIKRPIAVGEKIEIRPMMYAALSYDHRLVDGREAVQFLVGVKERVESPERLLFDL